MARFIQYDRYQQYILPPSVDEWLPEDHLGGESLFLRKIFPGFLLEKSAKITRPPMPSAAPIRPRHLVSTQQGVET